MGGGLVLKRKKKKKSLFPCKHSNQRIAKNKSKKRKALLFSKGFQNLVGSISAMINAEVKVRCTVRMVSVDTDRYPVVSVFHSV